MLWSLAAETELIIAWLLLRGAALSLTICSERVPQVAHGKAEQRRIVPFRERNDLEPLAHFRGQCQHHDLSRKVDALGDIQVRDVGDEIGNAAANQKVCLRRVA